VKKSTAYTGALITSALVCLIFIVNKHNVTSGQNTEKSSEELKETSRLSDSIAKIQPARAQAQNQKTSQVPEPWPNGESPVMKRSPAVSTENRNVRRLEETGPDLSTVSEDTLIERLISGPYDNNATNMRAAWELGNRCIAGRWIPSQQQALISNGTHLLLDPIRVSDPDSYSNSRNQLYRLWSLAHPSLLESLDSQKGNKDLVIKTLIATRTRELILELIRRYQTESGGEKKRLLAFTLSCMKEQRRVSIVNRQVMSVVESEKIYSELIEPVLRVK
jgi:hypothetical protein